MEEGLKQEDYESIRNVIASIMVLVSALVIYLSTYLLPRKKKQNIVLGDNINLLGSNGEMIMGKIIMYDRTKSGLIKHFAVEIPTNNLEHGIVHDFIYDTQRDECYLRFTIKEGITIHESYQPYKILAQV